MRSKFLATFFTVSALVLAAVVLFVPQLPSRAATVNTPNPVSHGYAADAGTGAIAITPTDGNVFQYPVRVWVGGAGTITVLPAANPGTPVTMTVAANTYVPLYVVNVNATGTTATLLVGIY